MSTRFRALVRAALCSGLLGLLGLAGCRTAAPVASGGPEAEVTAIHQQLERLYAAFSFDAGEQPDWETQRGVYLPGAVFVPPMRDGSAPRIDDTQRFLADFERFATSAPYADTGFHERIVGLRIDVFGRVAHAFVAFEGFAPADGRTQTRGLDSIQLVHDGEAWRLASFATQFEREGLSLPARFLAGAAAR